MDLEQQITNGEVALIVGLVHDPQEHTLTIDFARAREPFAVFGTLLFSEVTDYQFEINFDEDKFDEDKQDFEAGLLMEDLLGLREMGVGANPSHYIYTDVREISFNTAVAPVWQPMQE